MPGGEGGGAVGVRHTHVDDHAGGEEGEGDVRTGELLQGLVDEEVAIKGRQVAGKCEGVCGGHDGLRSRREGGRD